MKNRQRIEVIFTIDRENENAIKQHLAAAITKHFAGVSFTVYQGYWRSDGNTIKTIYENQLQQEISLVMLLSVLPERKNFAINIIKGLLTELKKKFDGFQSIHIEVYSTEAYHFDV